MEACVSMNRSKPESLALNFRDNISPFGASYMSEWNKSCRGAISATFKSNSLFENESEFTEDKEKGLKEQIEILKRSSGLKGETKAKRTTYRASEGSSDKENDSETINLSPMKSAIQIQEKEKRILELEGQLQVAKEEIERERKSKEEIIAEKDNEIERLQEQVRSFYESMNGDAEVLAEQVPQLKFDKSILTEELHKTIEKLEMMNNEANDLRHEFNNKIKFLEEKSQRETNLLKQGFLEKIDELEKEKNDLAKALAEAKEFIERADNDSDSVRAELYQIIQKLQDEKAALLEKLEDNENIVRSSLNDVKNKDIEIQDVKVKMQKEISMLEYELNECKLESLSYINELKEQNMSLRESVNNLDDEKYRLEEKFAEYVEKFDSSIKEIEDLKVCKEKHATQEIETSDRLQIEQKLTIEKEVLMMRLEQSERAYNQQIYDLEETLASKEQYIQGLLSEINSMKKAIEDSRKVSCEEKETDEKKELIKELEEIEEKEEFEEKEEKEIEPKIPKVQEIQKIDTEKQAEMKPEPKEETSNKPVIYYVEKPRYRYRSYYDNYSIQTNGAQRPNNRPSRDQIIYKPKLSHLNIEKELLAEDQTELKSASSHTPRSATKKDVSKDFRNERFSKFYRRPREEDPVYKQLEKMVMDLNDKLFTSDKRAKQFYEEKLQEVAVQQSGREQRLLEEIEKLKSDKTDLLKKIDDIQWEKAYEYTEKMKVEKEKEAKSMEANKKTQEEVKRKKKNNKSIHLCSFNEFTKIKHS